MAYFEGITNFLKDNMATEDYLSTIEIVRVVLRPRDLNFGPIHTPG
jgi:hypothetical protein